MKKTIAILGDTGEFSSEVIEAFLKQDLRLLFVSEDEARIIKINKQPEIHSVIAEIEFISCQREGCWEADIIVLPGEEKFPFAFIEKIKEVATQKIVLIVSEEINPSGQPELEKLLPFSKIVEIAFDTQQKGFFVSGKSDEAIEVVQNMLKGAGYQVY